jgi:hypothetical protein
MRGVGVEQGFSKPLELRGALRLKEDISQEIGEPGLLRAYREAAS